ncbi:MAG: hypothetical protein BGN85_10930 [Alphaproteobacteria bacterium 64-11]|nr:MAG: hypothetical protein BGN85_10930 [Alphaproteobacteria bacterium 64-11]
MSVVDVRRFLRTALTAAAVLLVTAPARAQDLETLNGTWQGSLRPLSDSSLASRNSPIVVRLLISNDTVQVFQPGQDGSFIEIKPGTYRIIRLKTNAVILSIDSGKDREGTWVQSHTYSVTLKDANTLITNLYWVVNNNDLPPSQDFSKFTVAAVGELVRQP